MEKNLQPLKPRDSSQNLNLKRKINHKEQDVSENIEETKLSLRDELWNSLAQSLIRRSPERVLLHNLLKFADNEFLQSALSLHKKNAASYFLEQESGIHSDLRQKIEMIRESDELYTMLKETTQTPYTEIELSQKNPKLKPDLELITASTRVKIIANNTEFILTAWHAEENTTEIKEIENKLEKMKILFEKIIDNKNRDYITNEVAAQSQAKRIPAFKVLSLLTIDK